MKDRPENLIEFTMSEWRRNVWPVMRHLQRCHAHLLINVGKSWGTFLKEVVSYRKEDASE